MLLIITNDADIHPNPVIDLLNQNHLPFFRLNTDRLLMDYDISYEISNQKSRFLIRYKTQPLSISSEQITCVWERRPMEPLGTYDDIPDEAVRKTVLEEADGFLRYFRYALPDDILWIGHPFYEKKAGSKILQKIVAKQIGFRIPTTLFTNNIEDIFLYKNSQIAIKPISSNDIPVEEGNIVFYTRKVSFEQLSEVGEKGFRNNINFLEEYSDKKYELRVTIIKDACFVAKIDSQRQKQEEGAVDWRQGYDYGLSFVKDSIPLEIEKKCKQFLQYFHLNFGCFDFIVTPDDSYIFLECNTNGQWLWLEEEAKLPISQTLFKLFADEIEKKR